MNVRQAFKRIDWKLLAFLILFLDVKLVVKLVAILFIYCFQFNSGFGFRLRRSRLPLFYPVIICIAIFNYFIFHGYNNVNYTVVFGTGIGFWLLAILALHQVKLSVENNETSVIHNTVFVFFLINTIASLATLLVIIAKTGAINPYLYQGEYQKYFIGTGDYIKGISFDTSTTNAVLNAFGVIYFLHYKNSLMVLTCMAVFLLTGSNISNMLLCGALAFVFIFQSDRHQKSLLFICLFLSVVFMTKISPQNNQYLVNSIKYMLNDPSRPIDAVKQVSLADRADSTLTADEKKQKIAILYLDSVSAVNRKKLTFINTQTVTATRSFVIPTDDINGPLFQHKSFLTPAEEEMLTFIRDHSATLRMAQDLALHKTSPGKIQAALQTWTYLRSHPAKAITGAGVGNFSSKLSFKSTGLNIAGSWPQRFRYVNKDFLANHLDLYLYYFTKPDGLHSAVNNPACVYDQLISEYGIAGLLCYFIFYMGFFLRSVSLLSFGIPLILVLSGIFFFDYWFEQLSVVTFFELLLFLNLKEAKQGYE